MKTIPPPTVSTSPTSESTTSQASGVERVESEAAEKTTGDKIGTEGERSVVAQIENTTYRLVQPLGHGAFGTVYRAERFGASGSEGGKWPAQIAVKVLENPSATLQEEARLWTQAQGGGSPHVVQCLGVGQVGDREALFLEFAPMGLPDVLRHVGQSTLKHSERIAVWQYLANQLLESLTSIHDQGILHRDIKPGNIVFDPDTLSLKLVDFGEARDEANVLKKTSRVIGSPGYISPEAAQQQPSGTAADIWSAAVLIEQMLTGRQPFEAAQVETFIWKMVMFARSGQPLRPNPSDKARPGVTAHDDFINRATRGDSEQRATLEELLDHPFLADPIADADHAREYIQRVFHPQPTSISELQGLCQTLMNLLSRKVDIDVLDVCAGSLQNALEEKDEDPSAVVDLGETFTSILPHLSALDEGLVAAINEAFQRPLSQAPLSLAHAVREFGDVLSNLAPEFSAEAALLRDRAANLARPHLDAFYADATDLLTRAGAGEDALDTLEALDWAARETL